MCSRQSDCRGASREGAVAGSWETRTAGTYRGSLRVWPARNGAKADLDQNSTPSHLLEDDSGSARTCQARQHGALYAVDAADGARRNQWAG